MNMERTSLQVAAVESILVSVMGGKIMLWIVQFQSGKTGRSIVNQIIIRMQRKFFIIEYLIQVYY